MTMDTKFHSQVHDIGGKRCMWCEHLKSFVMPTKAEGMTSEVEDF